MGKAETGDGAGHYLLTGPPRSGKTRRLASLFLNRSGRPAGLRGIALLPDRGAVEEFRAAVAGEAAAPGAAGFFDGGITTFEELAASILDRLPAGDVRNGGTGAGGGEEEPALPEEESLLLLHLKDDLPEPLAARIDSPGYRSALLGWAADLRESCLGPGPVDSLLAALERPAPRLEALREFLERLVRAGEDAGLAHRSTLPVRAAAALASGLAPFEPPDLLVVDGFHRFSPARLALLEALLPLAPEAWISLPSAEGEEEWSGEALALAASSLAERFDLEEVRLAAEPADREVVFLGGGDREEEMERIAREILRSCSDEGRTFEDHIVLFRDMNLYRPAVESAFRRFGVPYRARFQIALPATPAGRSLLELIDVARGGPSRSSVEAILKNRAFDADPELADRTTAPWRLEPEPDDPAALAGAGEDARLRGFASERIEPLLAAAAEIGERRGAEAVRLLHEHWAELTARWPAGELPAPADASLLGASFERADLLLRRSARLFDRLERLSALPAERVLEILEEEIARARFTFPSGGGRGVRIDDYRHGENGSAPVVFLAGLTGSEVPRPWQSGSFWNDADRAALNETGQYRIADRAAHRAEERFLFRRAFTRASERVYLTARTFDSGGKDLAESSFREEIREEAASGRAIDRGDRERFDSPRSIAVAADIVPFLAANLDPVEGDRRRLALAAALVSRFRPPAPRLPKDFRDPVHLAGHPRFDAWAASKEKFSVTELEDYSLCPWRYLSRHVLRLDEPAPSPEYAFSPGLEGEVIHEVLEKVLGGEGNLDELLPEAFEKRRGDFAERAPHRISLEAWREALAELIEEDRAFRGRHGWVPDRFEVRFGAEENAVPLDGRTSVTGRIDRIDKVDREGAGSLVVIDYKRQSPSAGRFHAGVERGLSLALPLYLRAASAVTGLSPAGAFLLGAKRGGRVGFARRSGIDDGLFPKPRGRSSAVRYLDGDDFEAMERGALDHARRVAAEARGGSFPVMPATDRVCDETACPYRDLCRVVLAALEEES